MICKHIAVFASVLLILSMAACSCSAPTGPDAECLTNEDMELTVHSAERGEGGRVVLTYSLANHSSKDYHFGRNITIEYKKDGEWIEIEEYMAFTDDLLTLPPGETMMVDAAFLSPASNGKTFRMTKNVYAQSNRESFDIQCIFEISE